MKEIENTIAEYFDKMYEMGMSMQLKPFGDGYRLEIGDIHIYFENKELTYTGWGMVMNNSNKGITENGDIVELTKEELNELNNIADRIDNSTIHIVDRHTLPTE